MPATKKSNAWWGACLFIVALAFINLGIFALTYDGARSPMTWLGGCAVAVGSEMLLGLWALGATGWYGKDKDEE